MLCKNNRLYLVPKITRGKGDVGRIRTTSCTDCSLVQDLPFQFTYSMTPCKGKSISRTKNCVYEGRKGIGRDKNSLPTTFLNLHVTLATKRNTVASRISVDRKEKTISGGTLRPVARRR